MTRTDNTIIDPELQAVSDELTKLKAGDHIGMYLTAIEQAADDAKIGSPYPIPSHDATEQVLAELNRCHRSLSRSSLSGSRIEAKLLKLSDTAKTFIQFKYAKLNRKKLDIKNTNWFLKRNRVALMKAVSDAREWARRKSGPERQENLHRFCDKVQVVYEKLTGKKPGIGGSSTEADYATPFERLFLASLRLIIPNATTIQAREIFRYASGQRKYLHSI